MAEANTHTENEFLKARVLFEKGLSEYNKNNHAEVITKIQTIIKLKSLCLIDNCLK